MSSQDVKKKLCEIYTTLDYVIAKISMNHDMTKTEREETKHLVDKAREMNKQDHMGNGLTKYEVLHGRKKILKIRKVNLQ